MAVLSHLLLATAALVSFTAAAPVADAKAGKFSITEVPRVKVGIKKNGTVELAKAFRKFNRNGIPKELLAAAAGEGSVAATPEEFDTEYLAPVTFGGGQTLNLDFDTGSSDLWVFSTSLPASERSGHTAFNTANSPTFTTVRGESWGIEYGDGSSAEGIVGTDTINIGGVTVTSQAIEVATGVSSEFVSDTDDDGILGLAFSSINTVRPTPVLTPFDNMKAQGSLAQNLFTVTLKHDAPGTYDFGFIDTSKFTGSLTTIPVNTRNGFWEVAGSSFTVGTGAARSLTIDAIVDTGTTLLLLPNTVVSAYYAQVSGAQNSAAEGGFIFPCSATLPNLTIRLGSYSAVVEGTFINFAPISATTCFGGLQSDAGIGFSILGDIFLKSQFVVFNGASTPTLEMARQAGV